MIPRVVFAVSFLFLSFMLSAQHADLKSPVSYLALGDSYTIGESIAENERWPNQLVDALRKRRLEVNAPRIIATTGWRTDDLQKAVSVANLNNDFSLVSLLIGVNNQYQAKSVAQYADEFENLVKTALTLANGKKENVFVVSIPDYGYTPFGESNQAAISRDINEFNSVSKRISEKLGVVYVNITDISRRGLQEIDLVAPDGLHPSGKMYSLWVERTLKKIL